MYLNLSGTALKWRVVTIVLLLPLFAGCSERSAPGREGPGATSSIRTLDQSVVGLTNVRSLDVYADGDRLHLLVAGDIADNPVASLHYIYSDDGGGTWSTPQVIDTTSAEPSVSRRGNDVQVAAYGEELVAIWQTHGEFPGMGPMAAAISGDAGKTWIRSASPADGDSRRDQGYMGLVADRAGMFHAAWLDDREELGNYQGLRYAGSVDGGRHWSADMTLDRKACTCCWTVMGASSGGAVHVLYRDSEPHDMVLAQSSDGGGAWRRIASVGEFDWQFVGCPHTGAGLAVVETDPAVTLHGLVWTGEQQHLGLYHLRSDDAGGSWTTPTRLGGEGAVHGDVAAIDADNIGVAWDNADLQGSTIFAALSNDAGASWSDAVRISVDGGNATHPRLLAMPSGFRVFWTEQNGEQRVLLTTMISKKRAV